MTTYKLWDTYLDWKSLTPLPPDKTATELWFKKGDLFVVLDNNWFSFWQIIKLESDIDSYEPWFYNGIRTQYEYMTILAPLPQTKIPTSWELRKMDGVKVRATRSGEVMQWEIIVLKWTVYILHNNKNCSWGYILPDHMRWYEYCRCLSMISREDAWITKEISTFEILSEKETIIQKLFKKKHTYTTTLTRDDWVVFTKDAIDGVNIEALTNAEQEHYKQAKAIRAKLNAHRNLTF